VGGVGRASSDLEGLVDNNPAPFPVLPSPPMNSDTFLWCMLLGRAGIVLGDARAEDPPNEKAGSCSPSPAACSLKPSLEPLLISIALEGRRPEDLEYDAGADLGDVDGGEGAFAGKTKQGSGRGPGLFSRGDSCDGGRSSSVVVRNGPLASSNSLNDIVPGDVAAAILTLLRSGHY